ncbi:MAG: hypothetical protein Q7V63_00715 [Gammaproteobacteria bacterium]|nr:hypothetical protein [Gammaproteobacteria bacterium]
MLTTKISAPTRKKITLSKIAVASIAAGATAYGGAVISGELPAPQFPVMTGAAFLGMQLVKFGSDSLRTESAVVTWSDFIWNAARAEVPILYQMLIAYALMELVKLNTTPTLELVWEGNEGAGADFRVIPGYLLGVLNFKELISYLVYRCMPESPTVNVIISTFAEAIAIISLGYAVEAFGGPDYRTPGKVFAVAACVAALVHIITDHSSNAIVGCRTPATTSPYSLEDNSPASLGAPLSSPGLPDSTTGRARFGPHGMRSPRGSKRSYRGSRQLAPIAESSEVSAGTGSARPSIAREDNFFKRPTAGDALPWAAASINTSRAGRALHSSGDIESNPLLGGSSMNTIKSKSSVAPG